MKKLTSALAAVLVLSTASVALAAPRSHFNEPASVVTKNVALPQANESWMDRASQSFDGGGY
jgi:hypothetical protein